MPASLQDQSNFLGGYHGKVNLHVSSVFFSLINYEFVRRYRLQFVSENEVFLCTRKDAEAPRAFLRGRLAEAHVFSPAKNAIDNGCFFLYAGPGREVRNRCNDQ